jgi:hypothetical protein
MCMESRRFQNHRRINPTSLKKNRSLEEQETDIRMSSWEVRKSYCAMTADQSHIYRR